MEPVYLLWYNKNDPNQLVREQLFKCYFTITVALVPEENPVHVGVLAEFTCSGPAGSTNHQWMINGTQFESLNLTDVTIRLEGTRLLFTNTPLRYNGTTVQCTLTAPNGVSLSSTVGTLLVQGSDSQLPSMYPSSSHYRVVGCCFWCDCGVQQSILHYLLDSSIHLPSSFCRFPYLLLYLHHQYLFWLHTGQSDM